VRCLFAFAARILIPRDFSAGTEVADLQAGDEGARRFVKEWRAMKHGRRADFFFTGVAIVPAALMLLGFPHVAFLIFFPLLFVACAYGMAEQVEEEGRPGQPDGKGSHAPQAPHIALRRGQKTLPPPDRSL
jgi:hypothetical protein